MCKLVGDNCAVEMSFKTKLKNKVIHSQSKEIVGNVLKFIEEESFSDRPLIPLNRVQERVASAAGLSRRLVQQIAAEMRAIESGKCSSFKYRDKRRAVEYGEGSSSNNKPRCRKRLKSSPKTNLEDIKKGMLRRMIINFFVVEKKAPTLREIHKKFTNEYGYQGSYESLRIVMNNIGFRWSKTSKRILVEKHRMRLLRLNFLRNIKRYRDSNRTLIYMDEINIDNCVIVFAGCDNCIVETAFLKFSANGATDNCNEELNFNVYKKWLEEMFIRKLPPKSVLVIDNARYHNVEIDKCPTSISSKDEMINWLMRKNIPFNDDMLKPDLYALIKLHRSQYKDYEIDRLLMEKGHNVLRLPPYHADLSPIEQVWLELKSFIANKNAHQEVMQSLCVEFFQNYSDEEWKMKCDEIKQIEQFFIETEPILDTIIDEYLINLDVNDGDNDSESESSDISDVEFSTIEEIL